MLNLNLFFSFSIVCRALVFESLKLSNFTGFINIPIELDKSINDLLIEFFKRIEKENNIYEIKDKFIFSYLGNKLDFNNKTKIKDFLNIQAKLHRMQHINFNVKQIY